MPAIPHLMAAAVALVGCVTDVRSRRVPNVLTLSAAAAAWGFFLAEGGLPALGQSVAGWLVGGVLFLPLFALRGMGGGDVKLIAALGAWLGPGAAVWLALYTAIAGGVFALVVAVSKGYTRRAFANLWGLLAYWRVAGVGVHPGLTVETPGTVRLPYSLPIMAGLLVTLWLQ